MDAVRRTPSGWRIAAFAAAALLFVGTARGSDEDVFRYRAYPNLLIVLDRSADMSLNDNVSVQDIDGNGLANRYDLALKVLFRVLNADGSRIDNNSTPPDAGSVQTYRNTLITVDDELFLVQRIGVLYYDNAVHLPIGPPFQVFAPDRPPNLPPFYNSTTGESWRYTAIWDSVRALGPPSTGQMAEPTWTQISNYFSACSVGGDNSASCRPKVTVMIVTPDSFESNGSLWGSTIDNSYHPFVLVVGSPNTRELKSTYKAGSNIPEGRIAFFSNNDDIENSMIFNDMVAQLQATTFEFVAPVVPAVRTTDTNVLFVASFTPTTGSGSAQALWPGHLISFDLNADGTIPSPIVTNWDAATRLASRAESRNIYTSSNGIRYNFDKDSITPAMLGVTTDSARDSVIDTVQSLRLGDIFHATPVVVGAPSRYFADVGGIAARQEFVDAYAHRKRIIIAGANDGMLHAFNAGNFNATLDPPRYTDGTGDEEWAYIPGFLLGKVKNFWTSPSVHNYYIDSAPAAADIWVDTTPPPSTAGKLSSEWHTVVIGGAGKGGKGYYALDITNPEASSYPALLWELTNDPADADRRYIGQTWSTPAIGKIQKTVIISQNQYVVDQWVAIVGGGMGVPTGNGTLTAAVNLNIASSSFPLTIPNLAVDTTGNAPASGSITITLNGNPNKKATGTYSSKTTTSFENVLFQDPGGGSRINYPVGSLVSWGGGTEGNAIFILNPWTGEILQRLTHALMGSVVAAPTILNNSLGYIERVYVGDMNGNMWRASYDNTATWLLGQGPSPTPFFSISGATYSKNIYTKAAVFGGMGSYLGSNWIAFGTGDRENPMSKASGSNGAIFVVLDNDPFDRRGIPTTTRTESNLQNESSFLSAVFSDATSGAFTAIGANFGWWGALGGGTQTTGEKMLSSPVVFNNNIFFTTFEPESGDCQVGGTARVYGFGALTGSYALYSDTAMANSTAADERMRQYTAAGIPSSPVVSMSGTGAATLYFGTTGSSVKSLKIPSPTAIKSLKYWREVN